MAKPPTYQSFEQLAALLKQKKKQPASPSRPVPAKAPPPAPESEQEIFAQAVEDVHPLGWSDDTLPKARPLEIQNLHQSEDEGLRLLREFVAGQSPFDLQFTGEYVEGSPHPRGKLLLPELRSGQFAVQAHLDLHGATREEARMALENFISNCQRRDFSCVRIIHGRGQHSQADAPVLKEHVQKWLSGRRLGRHILAYTSARLADGGGGALYVLLRKRHR